MPVAAVSRRAQEITPFLVMDILERAQELERQGVPVIHLEVGQPDWDTPQGSQRGGLCGHAAGRDAIYPFHGIARTTRGNLPTLSGNLWRQFNAGSDHCHFRDFSSHVIDSGGPP